MRLINCSTLELEEFFGSKVPPYAILSHTWGNDEVTFMDLPLYAPATQARAGYQKIEFTCKQAIRDQLKYAWVDTCCIDKRSSSELSEAINSMYAWYRAARRCYAYLSDVVEEYMGEEFRKSRWFTRGWTLQELLAPTEVVFYNCNWHRLGLRLHHSQLISKITGIDEGALGIRRLTWPKNRDMLGAYCVAKKMAWASSRDTTRIEDMAYCLLGMFEINMPLLYGEGDRAFHRLQEEIIRRVNDDSIFAWGPRIDISRQTQPISDILSDSAGYNCSSHKILASSPKDFTSCRNLEYAENPTIPPTLASLGLTIRLSLLSLSNQDDLSNSYFVGLLNCSVGKQEEFLGILIHAESDNNKSMTVMKRGKLVYRTFGFSTVLLSARHAQGAVDQTITLRESREGYPSLEWEWKQSKVDIVIETSATLLDMGYQLIKPICWIKLQSHRPEFMQHESIWDPDVMILSLRSNSRLNPLIEFRFEAPLNSHFSTLSIFLHVENSSAIAMKGGAFSDDDRLNIFSSLHPDAAQNDNEDVTIQSQAGQIHRVRVGVRKTTVHQRRIFELSAHTVLASTSSSLGGSVSSNVSFSLDVTS